LLSVGDKPEDILGGNVIFHDVKERILPKKMNNRAFAAFVNALSPYLILQL